MKLRMIGLVNPVKTIADSGLNRVCEVYGVTSTSNFHVPKNGLSCLLFGGAGMGGVMRDEIAIAGGEVVMVEINEHVATGSGSGRPQTQVDSAMSLEDLPVNEILRMSHITKDMRERCVEIISPHFKDNEMFMNMSVDGSIVTDLGLNKFIRQNPTAVDFLREADDMKHLKSIVYDGGAEKKTNKVVVMYRFDAPELRVLGRPNIKAVLPESVIGKEALIAQQQVISELTKDNVEMEQAKRLTL